MNLITIRERLKRLRKKLTTLDLTFSICIKIFKWKNHMEGLMEISKNSIKKKNEKDLMNNSFQKDRKKNIMEAQVINSKNIQKSNSKTRSAKTEAIFNKYNHFILIYLFLGLYM